jgi:hypothetical protein
MGALPISVWQVLFRRERGVESLTYGIDRRMETGGASELVRGYQVE